MSIHLQVTPRRQESQNSCWWVCMRMTLEYYGQRVSDDPSSFKPEFVPPVFRPVQPVPDSDILPDGTALLAPYEWYRHGVPMSESGLQKLCEITGFRPINERPAFGSWSIDDVEQMLRTHGPVLFVGNWNGQGFHAVLVVARERFGEGSEAVDEVIYIDPAMGFEVPVSLAHFNREMSSVSDDPNNPLYYPARPQVRDIVAEQHAGPLQGGVLTRAVRSGGAVRAGRRRQGPVGSA